MVVLVAMKMRNVGCSRAGWWHKTLRFPFESRLSAGTCLTCAWFCVTVTSIPCGDFTPQYNSQYVPSRHTCKARPRTTTTSARFLFPGTHTHRSSCLLSHFGSACGPGSCFSSPRLSSAGRHHRGESCAAGKQNKTMESVRHSKANGFTAAFSPPSLFMCKSIHRVLMVPLMHDTDSFKWPRKKMTIFCTPAELAENNSGGVLNQHFYLKVVQIIVYLSNVSRYGCAMVWLGSCWWWLHPALYPLLTPSRF